MQPPDVPAAHGSVDAPSTTVHVPLGRLAVVLDDAGLAEQLRTGLADSWVIVDDLEDAEALVTDRLGSELGSEGASAPAEGFAGARVVITTPGDAALGHAARVLADDRADVSSPDPEEIGLRLRRLLERQQLQDGLAEAAASREQVRDELSQFSYAISHDLKEPLRAITGFARLLETRHAEALEGPPATYLAFVTDGAARLEAMLNALLQHSRLGRQEVQPADVDLDALVQRALRESDASHAEVMLGHLPVVRSDMTLVSAIVTALIDNACVYTRAVESARVSISGGHDLDGAGWWLTVEDEGVGLEGVDESRVFDMFSRLHTREVYSGVGAGLALAKQAATRLGGDLTLSTDSGSTTFTLRVPTAG